MEACHRPGHSAGTRVTMEPGQGRVGGSVEAAGRGNAKALRPEGAWRIQRRRELDSGDGDDGRDPATSLLLSHGQALGLVGRGKPLAFIGSDDVPCVFRRWFWVCGRETCQGRNRSREVGTGAPLSCAHPLLSVGTWEYARLRHQPSRDRPEVILSRGGCRSPGKRWRRWRWRGVGEPRARWRPE